MTTLTTKPAYPAQNRRVQIAFKITNDVANFVRIWLVDAPLGSALKRKLEDSGQSRKVVHTGQSESIWDRGEFDKGGAYLFVAQEYTQNAGGYGGSHEGDPASFPSEDKVGVEYPLSIYIGQRMITKCGAGPDTADLVMYVWDDTIRSTSVAIHGEVTPRIMNGSSNRAKSAMTDESVALAVSALVDVNVEVAIGDMGSIASGLLLKIAGHLAGAGLHENDDEDNAPEPGYAQELTPTSAPTAVSSLLHLLKRHMLNDNGSGPGSADDGAESPTLAPYHYNKEAIFDMRNLPLFSSVSSPAEAYRALADIWRSYNEHRTNSVIHAGVSGDGEPSTLPLLLSVHRAFFVAIAGISPTVPPTQSTGAMLLIAQTGATES